MRMVWLLGEPTMARVLGRLRTTVFLALHFLTRKVILLPFVYLWLLLLLVEVYLSLRSVTLVMTLQTSLP